MFAAMPASAFSPELRDELAAAMQIFAALPGAAPEHDRLAAAMERACAEMHRAGLPAETMVIALRHIFEDVIPFHVRYDLRMRNAYDRFLTHCIRTFYGYVPPPTR